MTLRMLWIYLMMLCLPATASSDDSKNQIAFEAYYLALSKVEQGKNSIGNGQIISFTETLEEKEGHKKSNTKAIRLDNQGNEMPVSSGAAASSSLNWQFSLLVEQSRFPQKPDLIGETETTWIYSIPTRIQANVDENTQDVNTGMVNESLNDSLSTKLIISKSDAHLVSQQIYANSSFKPDPMVRINEFKIRIEYGQAWEDGPWVTKSVSRTLKGKYALFVNVEEFSVIRHKDFKLEN